MKGILPISALLITSLALSACGSDDDSSVVTGDTVENSDNNSSYEIRYSIVDNKYTSEPFTEYVVRNDFVLRNGSVQNSESLILGANGNDEEDIETTYYLAPNFYFNYTGTDEGFDPIIGSTVKIETPSSFSYDLSSQTLDRTLTITNTLEKIDISGVTIEDETIYTELNHFNLTNAEFPVGAMCNIFTEFKPSFSVFESYGEEPIEHQDIKLTSLEQWIERERSYQWSNNFDISHSTFFQVGENNEYRAVYLNDGNAFDSNKPYLAAIELDGAIYKAYYIEDSETYNTDSDTVYCDNYNDIAADYLEDQIKANYTLRFMGI